MGSEKLEASGGRPEVRELLLSLPSVGERGSFAEHNYAFMLSFYVLGFILRLFIVFLQKKNIKYLLSAYSDRNMFEKRSLHINNIFLSQWEHNVCQGHSKE